ncbi:MAG: protein kinase domain-containing protein, partial [Blastocatellia bacterium]
MAERWKIGDKIQNRWEIYNILGGPGKSGMGIVYVVYDHEWHEAFAAKTYQEAFADHPAVAERFTQEALAWVKLDAHHNITEARFVQQIEGKPYLFLEYVTGGDLSSWIGTPRLTGDLPQVLRFAIQFCDGMTHALGKGIKAHRDIKPQNCLITGDGTLKVTDFGLAKIFDEAMVGAGSGKLGIQPKAQRGILGRFLRGRHPAAGVEAEIEAQINESHGLRMGLTQTGVAAGTPLYMAPEQFVDAKNVDVRADIYSFGVMLFEMVMGHRPFHGRNWKDLERLHRTQPPPSLSASHSPLAAAVETCLAKTPGNRFGSFREVRSQMARLYETLTGNPAPELVGSQSLDSARLLNKGASLDALGRCDEAIACFDRAIEISPSLEQAWSSKGASFAGLGRFDEAIECYDRALDINPRFEYAWSNKGTSLASLGRRDEAIECDDRALDINPRFEQAWYNKGILLATLGRRDESIACYDRALDINPRFEHAWYNKGTLLAKLGRR